MDEKIIIAIAGAVVKKYLEKHPPRRGPKGRDGKDFILEAHKDFISETVLDFVESIRGDLKLNFSDLTDKERTSIKFKFSDLTSAEKQSLKGPRGQKGQAGKRGRNGKHGIDGVDGVGFDFEKEKENIATVVKDFVNSIESDLKLKFSDLTDDEKKEIQGAKGSKGRDGKDFIFEAHKESIDEIISSHIQEKDEEIYNLAVKIISENSGSLKLKFSDLTDDEKTELKGEKGSRGQKGKAGKCGLSAYELWLDEGNTGDKTEFLLALVGRRGHRGIQGLPGIQGLRGDRGAMGLDGRDGLDAPFVIDIEIKTFKKSHFYIRFHFSDLTHIDTNRVKFPEAINIIQQVMGGGGGRTSYVSLKPTYVDCDLTMVEYYLSTDQVVANRVVSGEFTYVSCNLTLETWKIYDRKDGTTVLRTILVTHTYDASDMLIKSEVSYP